MATKYEMPFKCIEPEKLYSKDPQLKKQDVEIIQEWLKKQPHLPTIEESQILVVLHSCYYKTEAAKTTIDNYFTRRGLCSEIFVALPSDALKDCFSVLYVSILPKTTPEGYAILFLKLKDTKAEKFNCAHIVNCIMMICSLYLHQEGFHDGVLGVFDMAGVSFAHLGRINLNVVKHSLYHVQEGMMVRIKGIHVINAIPLADKFMALVKPLLQNEILNLIQFHSPNSNSVYKFIPKECLPQEYGGSIPSIQDLNAQSLRNLLNNYDFFAWHENQQVDESKRVGKSKIRNDDGFGVDGTFKKLEID